MAATRWLSWFFAFLFAVFLVGAPYHYYRAVYTHGKRLRVVSPGQVYRSGCMTGQGFRDAIKRYGIRTIVNLQDEAPDPILREKYLSQNAILESELCREMGVRFVFLSLDLLAPHSIPQKRPVAIERFLAIMDEAANYPVLIHCRAGLHRTGVLTAIYRMEYEHWTADEAIRELKGHGFGDNACTSANDYITQYILTYKPGRRLK